MKFKTIFILVILLLFTIVLLQNTQVVTLKLFLWDVSMSQVILIPITLFIGILIGIILSSLWVRKRNKKRNSNISPQNTEQSMDNL